MTVLSGAFLLTGGLVCLVGAVGVLRFPDTVSRLQAATKPQVFGLLLVLAGTAMRLSPAAAVALLLVAVFQVMTTPVFAQLVGRAAYRTGHIDEHTLVVDELRKHR